MKVTLEQNEAVTDDVVAASYVDNFSAKIFKQADEEDRAGKSTRYGFNPLSQLIALTKFPE